MINTYYQQVASNARNATDNSYDKTREAFDSRVNPYDFKDIHCATLSLSGTGLLYYGKCHIKFKEQLIDERASVFEENPCRFEVKHNITGNSSYPLGHRATWEDRSILATTKLHSKLIVNMPEQEFERMLIQGDGSDADYIEVHIYGKLHPKTFESIKVDADLDTTEEVLLNALESKCRATGVQLLRE